MCVLLQVRVGAAVEEERTVYRLSVLLPPMRVLGFSGLEANS